MISRLSLIIYYSKTSLLFLLLSLSTIFTDPIQAKPQGHFYGTGGAAFPLDRQKGAATSGIFYRIGIGLEYYRPADRAGFEILILTSHLSAPKSLSLYRFDPVPGYPDLRENEEYNLVMFGGGLKFNTHRDIKRQILSLHLAGGIAYPDNLARNWFEAGVGIAFRKTLQLGVNFLLIDGGIYPVYMIPVTIGLRL
jgi:hypothetical protein